MATGTVPTVRRIVKAVAANARINRIGISFSHPEKESIRLSLLRGGLHQRARLTAGIVQSGSVRMSPAQSVREHLSSFSKSAEQLCSEFGAYHRSDQEHPSFGCVCGNNCGPKLARRI